MRKIFTDNLPKRIGGKTNWFESIGCIIKFIYDDIVGEIEILNYKNQMLHVRYKDSNLLIYSGNFAKCAIGNLIGKESSNHKYKVGDKLNHLNSGILIISKQIRIGEKRYKGYIYKCLICNNEDKIAEGSIVNSRGCNVCSNQKVLKGYNDIHTTHPNLGRLLLNYEDGFKYSHQSGLRVDFKCNNCGDKIKNKKISNIYRNGLSCPKCSDGISYPEKLLYNILVNSSFQFEYQKKFSWSTGKRYDFYIPSLKCIVEIHGRQHYVQSGRGRSLNEEQENDKLKKLLSESSGANDVKTYIIIDARESSLQYIRSSIKNSKLKDIIDLTDINWVECDTNCQTSLLKLTCDIWNRGNIKTKEIAMLYQLSDTTIRSYLKKGSKLGWCKYDPKEELRKSAIISGKSSGKPLVRLSLCGDYIDEYDSSSEAARKLGLSNSQISSACKGRIKTSGGFKWMYKETYKKYHNYNISAIVDFQV